MNGLRETAQGTVLITGIAGFIGASLAGSLLERYSDVCIVGVDNMNDYYDVGLKRWRIDRLKVFGDRFKAMVEGDISDKAAVKDIFEMYKPSVVVNLAAQAGVRYSIVNPDAYIRSNIIGFYNVLEAARHSYDDGAAGVKHLVYASSSSVYGGNKKVPFSEDDSVDDPVSLYAATKKSNELIAHSYAKLYGIPCTGLRFFTVYGPAGRPDMAYFSFTEKLRRGEKIKIFNFGDCQRDFTYIDDIIEGIIRVIQSPPEKSDSGGLPLPPHAIYNIGNSAPESLMDFVHVLTEELIRAEVLPMDFEIEAHIEKVPMQPGDVAVTYADVGKLERCFGYKPQTPLRDGLRRFAEWYRDYYEVQL